MIGRDTRISGSMLESALAAGICSVGGNVVIAGIIPTPAVAYLVRQQGFDAGAVISASHNPYPDNGIKFFDGNGYKLPDEVEDELENMFVKAQIMNWRVLRVMVLVKLSSIVTWLIYMLILYVTQSIRPLKG